MFEPKTEELATQIEALQVALMKRAQHHHPGEFTAANVRERLAICVECEAFLGNTCTQGEPCVNCGGAKDMTPEAFRTRVALQQWECPDHRWPVEKTANA